MACCFVIVFFTTFGTAIRPIPVSRLGFGGDIVRTTVVRLTVRGVAFAVRCVARLAFGLDVVRVLVARFVVVFRAVRPDELERDDFELDLRPLELDFDVERPRERLVERPPELRPLDERPRRAILTPQYFNQNNNP